jgi:hypothetical protein
VSADPDEPNRGDKLELDSIVFYGRTLDEYARFFDLDLPALRGKSVLDCPSGAASFAAEAHELGIRAVACDPLFAEPPQGLFARGERDIAHVVERVEPVKHLYRWRFYDSVATLAAFRRRALERFAADFAAGLAAGRYVAGSLPHLPFPDASFDLVLSAHFLFTYSDRLDYAFHLAAALDLARVARGRVRIYPLLDPRSRPYEHLSRLRTDLQQRGIASRLVDVDFEFQGGSNQMLELTRT